VNEVAPRPDAAALRAAWPAILFLEDLALVLGAKTPSGARRIILRAGIPHGLLGRRWFVRRETLEAWFASQEVAIEPIAPMTPADPAGWAQEILDRRRGRAT
jgi:hypothetical protein